MADSIEQLRSDFYKLQERSGQLYDDIKQLYLEMEKFGNRLRDFDETGRGSLRTEAALRAIELHNTPNSSLPSSEKMYSSNRNSSSTSGAENRMSGGMFATGTASAAKTVTQGPSGLYAGYQNGSSFSASRGGGGVAPGQTSEQRPIMSYRTGGAASSVPTSSTSSSRVVRASFPIAEMPAPAASRNENEKINAFVSEYNRVRRMTGYEAKTAQDAFLSQHQVRGIQCTNFEARANHPEIEPRFADAGAPQKGDFWALFIEGTLYAVVPNAKPYEGNKHNAGGMKEAFDSDYENGTYQNIEVTSPAVFHHQGMDWTIARKGRLRLSRS